MSDWHYELALKRELEVAEEVVTASILEELDQFKISRAIGEGAEQQDADLSPHQFTQLVAVAKETHSVPAIINYLRYQIARSGKEKGWRYAGVGAQIIAQLEGAVRTKANNAAQCAVERVRGASATATKQEEQRAWVELTRRFLASLRRCFVQRHNDLAHREREVTVP